MTRQSARSVSRPMLTVMVLAAFLSAALVGRAAMAQEKKSAAPAPERPANTGAAAAAVDDKVILPFIGEDTFIVARLDVARVDVDALEEYMNQMVAEMAKMMNAPPEAMKEMKAQMAEPLKRMREGLAEFVEAGGHHVYMLVSPGDLAGDAGPLLVVPLRQGADPAKLGELLEEMDQVGEATTAEVAKTLVFGTQAQIDGVKPRVEAAAAAGGKPAAGAERPDLTKAFAAAGTNAPLRAALVPGEAGRKFLEEHHPKLPEDLGGGDIKLVSRGIRWAAVGVTQKPAFAMNVTLQASDAERAKGLMDLLGKATAFAKAQQEPGSAVAKQLDAIKPKLQGEQITMTLDVTALQMGIFGGMGVSAEIEVDGDDAPAKPDDGGL